MYGPSKQSTSQLLNKDHTFILTEKSEQLKRWQDHFYELLSRPRTITMEALDRVHPWSILFELDAPPTLDKVIKAVKELKPNIAPGPDGIAANIYQYGGDTLTTCMYQLFIKLWEAAVLPQDLKDASIMNIYKDKRDCNNYHCISLLSVAGKWLAKIILRCQLSNITDNILPESQCGFWSGRGTVDMIFSLRQHPREMWWATEVSTSLSGI